MRLLSNALVLGDMLEKWRRLAAPPSMGRKRAQQSRQGDLVVRSASQRRASIRCNLRPSASEHGKR